MSPNSDGGGREARSALLVLVRQFRQNAAEADRKRAKYEAEGEDHSGNVFAFLKERRVWNEAADAVEAVGLAAGDRPQENLDEARAAELSGATRTQGTEGGTDVDNHDVCGVQRPDGRHDGGSTRVPEAASASASTPVVAAGDRPSLPVGELHVDVALGPLHHHHTSMPSGDKPWRFAAICRAVSLIFDASSEQGLAGDRPAPQEPFDVAYLQRFLDNVIEMGGACDHYSLVHHARAIREQLSALPVSSPASAMPEWQPIDTMPNDAAYRFLASPAHGRVIGAHVTGDVWHIIGVGTVTSPSERPTHWMPLPDPPNAVRVIEQLKAAK